MLGACSASLASVGLINHVSDPPGAKSVGSGMIFFSSSVREGNTPLSSDFSGNSSAKKKKKQVLYSWCTNGGRTFPYRTAAVICSICMFHLF